jgi:hypothetical protein
MTTQRQTEFALLPSFAIFTAEEGGDVVVGMGEDLGVRLDLGPCILKPRV